MARPGQAEPVELPAIAFSGRSNVGKSSLINRVLGRTRSAVARVSARPGKTQEINFYTVRARVAEEDGDAGRDVEFALVDLPGYGFAHVPLEVREAWKPLIESYLASDRLRGVVQLVDSRHAPTGEDLAMLGFLAERGLPTLVALTKVDKLKGNKRRKELESRRSELGLDREQMVEVSAMTGAGCDLLLASMESLVTADDE